MTEPDEFSDTLWGFGEFSQTAQSKPGRAALAYRS